MLVLSRRESEKIVFPSLGITVEVTRIKGNTVRLGVDAPREVRVLRAELDDDREHQLMDPSGPDHDSLVYRKPSTFEQSNLDREREIQENFDAVSLTVQLAQNQLRQGLASHAEEALENAMASLLDLEATLSGRMLDQVSVAENESVCVRESNDGYQVRRKDVGLAEVSSGKLNSQRIGEVSQLVSFLESEFRSWAV